MENIVVCNKYYTNDVIDTIDGCVEDMMRDVLKKLVRYGYGFDSKAKYYTSDFEDQLWDATDVRAITYAIEEALRDLGFPYVSDGKEF